MYFKLSWLFLLFAVVKSDKERMSENMKQRYLNREDEKQLERRRGAKNDKISWPRTLTKSVIQEMNLRSPEAQSIVVPSWHSYKLTIITYNQHINWEKNAWLPRRFSILKQMRNWTIISIGKENIQEGFFKRLTNVEQCYFSLQADILVLHISWSCSWRRNSWLYVRVQLENVLILYMLLI